MDTWICQKLVTQPFINLFYTPTTANTFSQQSSQIMPMPLLVTTTTTHCLNKQLMMKCFMQAIGMVSHRRIMYNSRAIPQFLVLGGHAELAILHGWQMAVVDNGDGRDELQGEEYSNNSGIIL